MDRQTDVRNRIENGETVAQIAKSLRVSRSTIYRDLGRDAPRKGARAAHAVVNVRLTDAELAGLDRAVERSGVKNRSAFVRRLARIAADMPVPTPEEEAFMARIETHLVALSGNFNQIARELSASRRKIGEPQPHQSQIYAINEARVEAVKALAGVRQMMENAQVRNARLLSLMQPEQSGAGGVDG
ncbi:MAG: helix-turn-helix domain-containing protein [Pseudomonadota bacterium]